MIPDKQLEILTDPNDLTLDDMSVFDARGFTAYGFRQFLIANSNWSEAEIGKIKMRELSEIADKVREAFGRQSVPLES